MHRMLMGLLLPVSALVTATEPARDPLGGTEVDPGFLPVHVDAAEGRVLMDVAQATEPMLLASTIVHALGSNDVGIDRAQNSDTRLVRFRIIGKRVLLIQENTRFVAESPDADEAMAAREAFAESVLWSGDWMKSDSRPDARLIDLGALARRDLHGIADRLRQAGQGNHDLDADRTVVLPASAASHPDNVAVSAMLTFSGNGEGAFVQQVASDPKALTLVQQLSFVRLPDSGYEPLPYHPASGGFSLGRLDFAQAIDAPLEQRLQPRFRLEKTNPDQPRGKVRKPIVFYLDRGTPEPIRSALLEGANWWQEAFEAAGFIDAFRAELAPPDVAMDDVRYNTITWTHRATRGWSYGGGLVDPRTGEIIKGYVNLGSQRVRQDLLIAEGLLAPHAPDADPALKSEALAMALHRLKQLAAHEVGHALGFAHNFAASRSGTGSVLDYPHPQVRFDESGRLRLDRPYDTGVGDWDKFLVAHAYGVFPARQQEATRAALREAIRAQGYAYVSDADARAPGDAHAEGLLWDVPGDAVAGLAHLLRVRQSALARFASGALPPDRQSGETERRFVPIYLLHRYQVDAVARLLGGVTYGYGEIGDSGIVQAPVDASRQKSAVAALSRLIEPEVLHVPTDLLPRLLPPPNDYQRSPEHLDTHMAPVFDPVEAARVATAVVGNHVLEARRINRMAWQHALDPSQPGPDDLFDRFVAKPWDIQVSGSGDRRIVLARNWVLLDGAIRVLESGALHADVAAGWRRGLSDLAERLARSRDPATREAGRWLSRWQVDPGSVPRRAPPRIPPGAPI